MSKHFCLKYYKLFFCSAFLALFFLQQVSLASETIFEKRVNGHVSIEEYHNFHLESSTELFRARSILIIDELKAEIEYSQSKKPKDYPKMINTAQVWQKRLFDRLELYKGMEVLNYEDYKKASSIALDLIKETANIYLKIGNYYTAVGDIQNAKSTYRHIIVNYTDDIFKPFVKKAEFALKDLEDEQQRLLSEQQIPFQSESKKNNKKRGRGEQRN